MLTVNAAKEENPTAGECGKNVFENSDEDRVPYVIIFSLPEEEHLLLRQINAINNFAIYSENGSSRIDLIAIPTNANFIHQEDEITMSVTSTFLRDYIKAMVTEVPIEYTEDDNSFDIVDTEEE